MTDDEILEIQEALRDEPEWMQVSFEIGLHTGCRLRETRIPLSCVDFRECKITFPNPKGGEDRAFSIPMPTVLVPLLEKLKAEDPAVAQVVVLKFFGGLTHEDIVAIMGTSDRTVRRQWNYAKAWLFQAMTTPG